MFDIGFWELVLIGVVALVVIGPERLPKVARAAGKWFGKMRGFVGTVKADIDREMKADELRRVLDTQNAKPPLEDIEDIMKDTKAELTSVGDSARDALKEAEQTTAFETEAEIKANDEQLSKS